MDFKEFLVNNWQYISIGILCLLDVLIIILKRRPKKWDELNNIISQAIAKLPGFIQSAETMGSDYTGMDKKNFVVSWIFEFIQNALKRDLSLSEEQYCYKAISWAIENILDCPTKKGGCGREQEESDETI